MFDLGQNVPVLADRAGDPADDSRMRCRGGGGGYVPWCSHSPVSGPGWCDGRLSQSEAVELQSAENLQGLGVESARTVMGTQHGDNGAQRCGARGPHLDVDTGAPEWAAVTTGMVGGHAILVPLAVASTAQDEVSVPYSTDLITRAPHHNPAGQLSTEEEAELFAHYGVPYSGDTVTADVRQTGTAGAAQTERADHPGGPGREPSGPTTDAAMTRSEEQLRVGTRSEETGRARLRKYVVSETVSQTVPVSHEELRVQRQPITHTDREQIRGGVELSEEEHEVILHAEKPVVGTETVPVERVRLATDTITGEQTVSAQVRQEQIEQVTDDAADTTPRR